MIYDCVVCESRFGELQLGRPKGRSFFRDAAINGRSSTVVVGSVPRARDSVCGGRAAIYGRVV